MSEIKCPHCGEVFKVDEQGYAAIVAQVKTAEFDKELDKRVADEKDKALKLAKLDFDSKYTKAVNDKDMEIQKLKAAAANGESEKTLAVTKAQESTRAEYEKMLEQLKEQISQNEKLIAQLTAQTKSMTTEKELAISMAVEKARSQFNSEKDKLRQEISQRDMQIQQLNSEHTLQMQKSENEYKAEITRLETDIKNKDTEKALELTTALSKVESEKNSTIAELNAQIANLENVYAAKADITELSAQIATIDNLTAKKADVEQLYAKKADIDELVADTATLKSLKSNVANIDVLLSGKAGTGELTSIKLTAENAEIATALIKDLTAANFRSKTIETDDFTIKSSSGKLQIVGNTIQIKDVNNTVRVQIGEDGKSDYGIYVTDAGGKIMFTSYDGLHEDGIKSGIIKNDMVADDAHISGSKLDISSVIDGINADNSTYLNTSKVVIDGTSQTINAKFTELTASIGSIGTRTSVLESDLSGFRTTVSETYATKSAVDGIQIGGRNLLYDSTGNIKNGWSGTTVVNVGGGISGNSLSVSRTGYSGNARYFGTNKRHFLTDFNVGTCYTLSAWIKVGSNVELDASGYVMARFRSADDKKLYALSLTVSSQTEKDKWIYYEKTWTINDSDIAKLECVALALDKNGMIEACNIKLEKGTKATDWSPAPEDTTAEITSLSSKQSSLEQTVNGFKANIVDCKIGNIGKQYGADKQGLGYYCGDQNQR